MGLTRTVYLSANSIKLKVPHVVGPREIKMVTDIVLKAQRIHCMLCERNWSLISSSIQRKKTFITV